MQLGTHGKKAWLRRIANDAASAGRPLLAELNSDSNAIQDRIKRGALSSASGSDQSASYSDTANGFTITEAAELAGELIERYYWAADTLDIVVTLAMEQTDTSNDAAILASMLDSMPMRPPGGAREVYHDYSMLRSGVA